jgi:hypothetical protein
VTDLTSVELLSRTLDLLDEPTRWTQGAMARDTFGVACDYNSTDAVCWCLTGAFLKVNGGPLTTTILMWHKAFGPKAVCEWNDRPSTSHRDVVIALEAALAIQAMDWDRLQEMGLLTAQQRKMAEWPVRIMW